MRHEDDFIGEWEAKRIDRSRPPLRWIANIAGSIASSAILRVSLAEEEEYEKTFAYKRDSFIFDKLWPIYDKWGTIYQMKDGGSDDY